MKFNKEKNTFEILKMLPPGKTNYFYTFEDGKTFLDSDHPVVNEEFQGECQF